RVLLWGCVFFFQAEGGIGDWSVTGVQTCALPICHDSKSSQVPACCRKPRTAAPSGRGPPFRWWSSQPTSCRKVSLSSPGSPCSQIGRASCRERGEGSGVAGAVPQREREG